MEKNKLSFIAYILIFCISLTFVLCFYLGKSWGSSDISTSYSNKDDLEIAKGENVKKVKEEINKMFNLLNKKDYKKDDILTTNYVEKSLQNNDNLLVIISPLIAENIYNIKYEEVNTATGKVKVMDNDAYQQLRQYFNVILPPVTGKLVRDEVYLNKGYKYAYSFGGYNEKNKLDYELEEITKVGDYYEVSFNIKKENQLFVSGSFNVTLVNGNLYFEGCSLKET